ncbi:MAG: hypothetical protein KF742_05745 [Cryobacterium sp.]|nr:hypothetical protein [Cryobacterium sp.]
MARRAILALIPGLCALALVGCAQSSTVEAIHSDGMVLLRSSVPSTDAMQAIVGGELSVLPGGCIGFSGGGEGYLAVFSSGTELAEDGVSIAGLGEFKFGDTVRAQGGVAPGTSIPDDTDWLALVPEGCPIAQIYFLTP